ncbi:hypothetical protein [Variovorax sp. UC74_104]|uniref:hypothetical protein n=1 Tax=Variovorax sp. UC74_104 TaxID=3374555 RepID=UPI00375821CC
MRRLAAVVQGGFVRMGGIPRTAILALALWTPLAEAQTADQERTKGAAAAALVMSPQIFLSACNATAKNDGDYLFCTVRSMAAEKGAKFMYDSKLREIRDGRDRRVAAFVLTKQFAEKVYDNCMMRHADEIESSGSFSQSDSICKLEKTDTYEGMTHFNKVYHDSIK